MSGVRPQGAAVVLRLLPSGLGADCGGKFWQDALLRSSAPVVGDDGWETMTVPVNGKSMVGIETTAVQDCLTTDEYVALIDEVRAE